jgi:LCP family protein required for cell wall assembly
MPDIPQDIDKPRKKHRVLKVVSISLAVVLIAALTGGYLIYQHLNGNITAVGTKAIGKHRPKKVVKTNAPTQALNILLLGSDTRKGQTGHIGGATPGLSDTTILLHLSADRKHAYGISIPRDTMVQMPSCPRKSGNGTYPGGLTQFNDAYAIGGATCTVKTVEHLTHLYMDHFVVLDFNGFRRTVSALGGVQVCVPRTVNDTIGHIYLKAGTYDVSGEKALDYVRIRELLSPNGDIGRMARQQAFLSSMIKKAFSIGTLANPVKLYNFLDAATKSLTTDKDLASVAKLASLGEQVKNIGLDKIKFLTVPFQTYAPDPNRLQFAQPAANRLWHRLRQDKPLTKRQTSNSQSPGTPKHQTKTANGLCA